jgi:hypothetical protein
MRREGAIRLQGPFEIEIKIERLCIVGRLSCLIYKASERKKKTYTYYIQKGI